MGLQYTVQYKKGANNAAADALSRKVHGPEVIAAAISVSQPAWIQEIVAGYEKHIIAQDFLAALAVDPDSKPKFSLVDGLIRYQGRIWVGNNTADRNSVV